MLTFTLGIPCSGTKDPEYLRAVERALAQAAELCPHPDLVFYNAGEQAHMRTGHEFEISQTS